MNGDQPAFPGQIAFDKGEHRYGVGITLRHVFAGLAMQGFIASTPDVEGDMPNIVRLSRIAADSLLEELEGTRS